VEVCPVTPIKANKPNPKFGNVRMIDTELCWYWSDAYQQRGYWDRCGAY
jgi:hypothetical protein